MNQTKNVRLLIVIAALGYFVDVYDLILFIIVRQPSLQALGFTGAELTQKGINLLNLQMLGMLIGGIVWGVLGDKKGRLSVLFGTIPVSYTHLDVYKRQAIAWQMEETH